MPSRIYTCTLQNSYTKPTKMLNAIRISPSIKPIISRNPLRFPRISSQSISISNSNSPCLGSNSLLLCNEISGCGGNVSVLVRAWSEEGFLQEVDVPPVWIELLPICNESQFDRIMGEAQQLEESVIIVWMASWCRKCIYLKPKLEKLAADYHPRLRFYCVDVNAVPHKLVVRAGVTKMPTIQLWKDGKKQQEVLGGHKAYMVVNEVREMIESQVTL